MSTRRCTRCAPRSRRYPDLAHFFIEIQLQAALAGNGLSASCRVRDCSAWRGCWAWRRGFRAAGEPAALSQGAAARRPAAATAAQARQRRRRRGATEERMAQAYSVLEADRADVG